ncbi:hypothetical protein E2C01_034599 [Portunus trituberculatus]|uniref:Uncharacterized protein n=1 Tax=Portunus trituberculatus TaxID=210409 RepID=A0A5B7F717_PORTR|nr:hypothetical protein [Portunus trituberculatus]
MPPTFPRGSSPTKTRYSFSSHFPPLPRLPSSSSAGLEGERKREVGESGRSPIYMLISPGTPRKGHFRAGERQTEQQRDKQRQAPGEGGRHKVSEAAKCQVKGARLH